MRFFLIDKNKYFSTFWRTVLEGEAEKNVSLTAYHEAKDFAHGVGYMRENLSDVLMLDLETWLEWSDVQDMKHIGQLSQPSFQGPYGKFFDDFMEKIPMAERRKILVVFLWDPIKTSHVGIDESVWKANFAAQGMKIDFLAKPISPKRLLGWLDLLSAH